MRPNGFTLMELLIATMLLSIVFLTATMVYTSGLRFLGVQVAQSDVSQTPEIAMEDISRKIATANFVSLTQGGSQLNLRIDYAPCTWPTGFADANFLKTPANTNDDGWWHYRLLGNQVLRFCDGPNSLSPALVANNNPAGTSVLSTGVTTAGSSFTVINPTASGTGGPLANGSTVVSVRLVGTTPVKTVDTETALGAASKN